MSLSNQVTEMDGQLLVRGYTRYQSSPGATELVNQSERRYMSIINLLCVCVTHRRALSQEAGLLHPAGPSELLHVLTEVTLPTLGPHAGLAAPAPRPPAPCPPAQRLTARHPRTSQLQPDRHIKVSITVCSRGRTLLVLFS